MPYPLNFNVKKGYSLAFVDGYLKIENGISGTYCFLAATVAMVANCDGDKTCDSTLKRFVPDTLTVWGYDINCCKNQLSKISLDPANFGFDSVQDLIDAIEQAQGVEIRNTPQFTGFDDNGKPIFKQSFLLEGFSDSGADFDHGLNIDKYINLSVDAWLPADENNKKELHGNASGGLTSYFYENKQPNTIKNITTAAGYTTVFVVIDYTVF